MARVYDLVKDRRMIYSVDANSTVLEAARFMTEHNIGAVAVVRDGGLAGQFRQRELIKRGGGGGGRPGPAKGSRGLAPKPRGRPPGKGGGNKLVMKRGL